MRDVYVLGVGMTGIGKYLELSIKDLAQRAAVEALSDAGVAKEDLQAVWFSNSAWGYFSDQHYIRGQVALRGMGICGIPITNVENACAGGATAFHSAWMGVASGLYDCVMAIGAEKLYSGDKRKMFGAFSGAVDVERMETQMEAWRGLSAGLSLEIPPYADSGGAGKDRSPFMDVYASWGRWHMATYGTTQRQLAVIASKNHSHSALNPLAQFRKPMSVEEVLAGRLVIWPLTVPMCAPVGDGGGAAILCSREYLARVSSARPVKVRASALASGTDRGIAEESRDIGARLARQVYEKSGVGPEDIDVAEVHDATAFGELHQTEALGFCPPGEGGRFAESGATRLGGRLPINPSGGLESRGHPIGASGLAQIHELVIQLRHEAGQRQVEGCRIALAENGGGNLGFEEAAMCVHILERVGGR